MATPYITPNQSFNITVGTYFSQFISYTGSGTLSWYAVGLPDGLTLDSTTGQIKGTPIKVGTRFAYVVLTNQTGSSASVIGFTIKETITSSLNISISPTVGFASSTPYQFTTNISQKLSAYSLFWNFGDNGTSDE